MYRDTTERREEQRPRLSSKRQKDMEKLTTKYNERGRTATTVAKKARDKQQIVHNLVQRCDKETTTATTNNKKL
jgi:2-oxo-4-hydroxy-4-carboxy--5-ureidoimidazoline (OHCU) decarboxylase